MGLVNFRAYQLSVRLYREVEQLSCAAHLRSQLLRAASSVSLNLAEGSGKESAADRRRSYLIALGSFRECEAIFELCSITRESEMGVLADQVGAHVFRLCYPRGS
jgi:four helix bundle protein